MEEQTEDIEALEEKTEEACRYDPDVYFVECICCDFEHVCNIILAKKTGTTFAVKVQDKVIYALLDTGAEKSCMSSDMFSRLKLSINAGKTPKLRNASGKDMRTQVVMMIKFQMRNTMFTQDFIGCNDLVRRMISQ